MRLRCLKPSPRISPRSCHLVAGSPCCAASAPPPPRCCPPQWGDSRLRGASVVWSWTGQRCKECGDYRLYNSIYGWSIQYNTAQDQMSSRPNHKYNSFLLTLTVSSYPPLTLLFSSRPTLTRLAMLVLVLMLVLLDWLTDSLTSNYLLLTGRERARTSGLSGQQ